MSFTYKTDHDFYGHPELDSMNDLLELVKIDIKRIFYLLGPRMGKIAIIKRSQNGFHASFPFSRLTEEEVNWLMEGSPLDTGFRWWVIERGSSTLRISEKVIVKEIGVSPRVRIVGKRVIHDVPFILEIIKNPYMYETIYG